MKKILLLISFLLVSTSLLSQELKGIWMSYNDRIINEEKVHSGNIEGVTIDFNRNEIKQILSDSSLQISIDYQNKIIESEFVDLKTKFKQFENDSIEIEIAQNTISVFHPLKLNYPIHISKSDLSELIVQDCWREFDNTIQVKFSNNFHPLNSNRKIKMLETIWNDSKPLIGNWFLEEIENNYFLFLTIEDTTERNIYQIISVENERIKLKPFQEHYYKIREIKTCM